MGLNNPKMELPSDVRLYVSHLQRNYPDRFIQEIKEANKQLSQRDLDNGRQALNFLRESGIHKYIVYLVKNWKTLTDDDVIRLMSCIKPFLTSDLEKNLARLRKRTIKFPKISWSMYFIIIYLTLKGYQYFDNPASSMVRAQLNFMRDFVNIIQPEIATFSTLCLLFLSDGSSDESHEEMKLIYETYQTTIGYILNIARTNLNINPRDGDFEKYYQETEQLFELSLQDTAGFMKQLEIWKQNHNLSGTDLLVPSITIPKTKVAPIYGHYMVFLIQHCHNSAYKLIGIPQDQDVKDYIKAQRDLIDQFISSNFGCWRRNISTKNLKKFYDILDALSV